MPISSRVEDGMVRPMNEFLHGCVGGEFTRFLPEQIEHYSSLSPLDAIRCRCPAGMYWEFITDSPEITFTYNNEGFYCGGSRFDIHENGVLTANIPLAPAGSREVSVVYQKKEAGESLVRITFPNGAAIIPVRVEFGHARPTAKRDKTVLFYGDSITQSAYIPTPSLSWTGYVADALEAEEINRGIGSFVFDEKSLPESDFIQPEWIFVEYGPNDISRFPDLDDAMARAEGYLARLQKIYPDAAVYVITPDFLSPQGISAEAAARLPDYCRRLTEVGLAAGMKVIPGRKLVPDLDVMFWRDHLHLNEAGSAVFAHNLLRLMKD